MCLNSEVAPCRFPSVILSRSEGIDARRDPPFGASLHLGRKQVSVGDDAISAARIVLTDRVSNAFGLAAVERDRQVLEGSLARVGLVADQAHEHVAAARAALLLEAAHRVPALGHERLAPSPKRVLGVRAEPQGEHHGRRERCDREAQDELERQGKAHLHRPLPERLALEPASVE